LAQGEQGALVPGGPEQSAEKQGLSRRYILEFDGKEVSDSKELPRIVASTRWAKRHGQDFKEWKDDDRQVKLGEMEEKAEVAKAPSTISVWDYGSESDP